MAKKAAAGKSAGTKTSAKAKSDDNVVRIKASSSAPKKQKDVVAAKSAKPTATETKVVKRKQKSRSNPLAAIGGYFKGAWVELRQVRWPTRRATWSLTGAVLIYSAFFVILVLLLDALFKYLFEIILGK